MELFWIVAGLVYVIYKAFEENPRGTIFAGSYILTFLIPAVLGSLIAAENEDFKALGIIIGLSGFVVCLIRAVVSNRRGSAEEKEAREERNRNNLAADMRRAGYNIIDEHIDRLATDPSSPLHTTNQLRVPLSKCYYWLCLQRSVELQRMKTPQLEDIIGVPYSTYPRNTKKTLGESDAQKKHLVVKTIMEREGLSYPYRFLLWKYNYYCTDDYSKEFVAYLRDHAPSLPEQTQENNETEHLDTQENSVTEHLD